MTQFLLDALLFLYGVDSITSDVVEYIAGFTEITKDALNGIVNTTLFTYFLALATGLLIIYFMLDILGHAQRELLNTDYLINGFIKLVLVLALLLFSSDLAISICNFGSNFFHDVENYMNETNDYRLAIYAEWGASENITPYFSVGGDLTQSAIEIATGGDLEYGNDLTFHNGLWLFENGGQYDANWHSGDSLNGNQFLLIDNFTSLTDPSKTVTNFHCESRIHDVQDFISNMNPFSDGDTLNSFHHPFSDVLEDGQVFGSDNLISMLSHLGILLTTCCVVFLMIIVKITCLFFISKVGLGIVFNGLMMPVGIAHLGQKGEESASFIYIKRFAAKCISFALMMLCIYVFNVLEQRQVERTWLGSNPIFSLNGVYNSSNLPSGYFYGDCVDDKHTLVILLNGRSLSSEQTARLSDLFRFDIVLYAFIPSAALISALMGIDRLSKDILGVD